MAENSPQNVGTDNQVQNTTGEGNVKPAEPTNTTDWKAEARKWEARAKENKEKADKFDEFQESQKSELERAQERAQQAEKQVEAYKHAEDLRNWANEVSSETHVPASVLRGDTREEMEAHAKQILDAGLSSYGSVPDKGNSSGSTETTEEQIDAIKDPTKRIRARARFIHNQNKGK